MAIIATTPAVLAGHGAAYTVATQLKLYIANGSGNPADGFSFCLASDNRPDPTAPQLLR